MRILHVVGRLNRGGAETWLVQTLRHIDRRKYSFDFLVHTQEPSSYDSEVQALGCHLIPCLSLSNPAKYAHNFFRILRKYGPYDCVHSHVHRFSGFVLALARMAGVPVRVAHSHCDTRVAEMQKGLARRLYFHATDWLIKACATAGLAVSAKAAVSLFGEDWKSDPRWHLSQLGIELEPFTIPIDKQKIREELHIDSGAFVVGHVGRFFTQKNHVFLMDVASKVCALRPDAIFLLVGDGPLRSKIEDKARGLGIFDRMRFVGVREDVPTLMRGAMDVFLFPSFNEGFPVVLMEAQAAGLPCLISDVITSEIDIIPGLIHRLSLGDPATTWACTITNGLCSRGTGPNIEMMRYYGIDGAVLRLCDFYDRM